jgi:hypothetical protein
MKLIRLSTVLAALCAGCSVPPAVTPEGPRPVRSDADVVVISSTVPIDEFVKLAQEVTGRVIVYSPGDFADAAPIGLIGTVRVPRETFFDFFQTTLYTRGFACEVQGTGAVTIVKA